MRRQQPDDAVQAAELAALADGSLAPERRAELEARVAASPELADLLAEQQRAVALTRSAAAEVEAPAALRARIEQRPCAPPAGAAAPASPSGPPLRSSRPSSSAWRCSAPGTSGERFRAALAPTALVPGASGSRDAHQDILGLADRARCHGASPPRRRPLFYEAWLRNRAGVLVPIGTFNEGRKVTLWAGVSPKDYPSLTVTREQADGNQASSGEKVLVGTAPRPGTPRVVRTGHPPSTRRTTCWRAR